MTSVYRILLVVEGRRCRDLCHSLYLDGGESASDHLRAIYIYILVILTVYILNGRTLARAWSP